MKEEHLTSEEAVIKEYPNYTYWLEGYQLARVGNLILTNERLIFLNLVALSKRQAEDFQELYKAN